MMTLIRITSADDSRSEPFDSFVGVFPESERRKIGQLKRMIENHAPNVFHCIECDGELSGRCLYIGIMGDFYYLEHLAVFPEMRNKKIGHKCLIMWLKTPKGVRLLESKPTEDEMTTVV